MGSPEGWEREVIILGPGEPIERIADLFLKNSKTHVSIIIGECDITYEGRASSKAPWGVRVVIYKADGTLIIHEGRDREPLNWQPPGSLCIPSTVEGQLVITCNSRKYGYEVVVIRFKKILASIWSVLRRLSAISLTFVGLTTVTCAPNFTNSSYTQAV